MKKRDKMVPVKKTVTVNGKKTRVPTGEMEPKKEVQEIGS